MKLLVCITTATILFSVTAVLAQDAAAGANVFKKCVACHSLDEGKNKAGPSLYNVIGRVAGGVAGYQYSPAMKEAGASGMVWDEAAIAAYVSDPKAKLKGTKMVFGGLKKPEEIKNLLAYLKTVSK